MPVVKHGLAFKYFDKAICGVVALGLLAAVVLALSRAGSASRDAPTAPVAGKLALIEAELGKQHVSSEVKDYIEPVLQGLTEVRTPRTVDDKVFYPPLPVTYPPLAISTDRGFVLEFNAPLDKDTITVEGLPSLVSVQEHPVEGDYKDVRLASGAPQC